MSAEYARFLRYQLKVEDGRRGIFWKYKIDQLAIDDKKHTWTKYVELYRARLLYITK